VSSQLPAYPGRQRRDWQERLTLLLSAGFVLDHLSVQLRHVGSGSTAAFLAHTSTMQTPSAGKG
jgi:hypothetical protein